VVAASDIVTTAQTIISRRTNISKLSAVVTFGAINGGVRYNIIPDEVELIGTIRTFDEDMRKEIIADLVNVAEHVAAAHGAHVHTHKVPMEHGYPVTVNHPELTVRMRPSLEKPSAKTMCSNRLRAWVRRISPISPMKCRECFSLSAQRLPNRSAGRR